MATSHSEITSQQLYVIRGDEEIFTTDSSLLHTWSLYCFYRQ